MTSSSKRKKEKKKDFQKPKLKVGKAKPKTSNFTDTSFKAKSIILSQQSISTTAPSSVSQFSHHLSLLKHKSDVQRRESLAYLTTAVASRPVNAPLPQPVAVIIPEVQHLIRDGSNNVRHQLLKLLKTLPAGDVRSHVHHLLLHTQAGMNHLAADIRSTSLDMLEWLLEVAGNEVVSCAGGWVKTLKTFLGLLGWQTDAAGKLSSSAVIFGKAGIGGKLRVKQMHALASFLRAGLVSLSAEDSRERMVTAPDRFPLWHPEQHFLVQRSSTFAHLNLFGAPRNEDAEMYEDREDRQRVFNEKAQSVIEAGLEQAKREGGEVGRAAARLNKALTDGMADFSSYV